MYKNNFKFNMIFIYFFFIDFGPERRNGKFRKGQFLNIIILRIFNLLLRVPLKLTNILFVNK